MSRTIGIDVVVCVLGTALGLGLAGIGRALVERADGRGAVPAAGDVAPGATGSVRSRIDLPAIAVALVAGVVCTVVTGWPVAGPIAGAAAYGLPRLLRSMSAATSIAKIEAVATWTELLQGTLAASAGLGQAIMATAELSPSPIRGATELLAAQIQAGVHPRDALVRFADDIADPCADRVVCALMLAFSSRAQRLGDLLSALAESTREEVSMRLRVETSRASVRSGVRTVVVFSVAFAAALSLLARAYLEPFHSTTGQCVLAVVGGLYAAGLVSMVALARPPEPIRLLGRNVVER